MTTTVVVGTNKVKTFTSEVDAYKYFMEKCFEYRNSNVKIEYVNALEHQTNY